MYSRPIIQFLKAKTADRSTTFAYTQHSNSNGKQQLDMHASRIYFAITIF